jgi:hypothetical protein
MRTYNCRFSSFLSPRIALTWAWVQASHRFVFAVSHRSVIFPGRPSASGTRMWPAAEAPAVTESQRRRTTALRVSAPNAESVFDLCNCQASQFGAHIGPVMRVLGPVHPWVLQGLNSRGLSA